MMFLRKTIPCILCWCFCLSLAAQNFAKTDSLEQVLATGKLKDSEKAELLKNLSSAYLYTDTAKCRAYAVEALKYAQSSGSKLAEAKVYTMLGNVHAVMILPYQSHAYFKKAEKLFLELGKTQDVFGIYRNLMLMFATIEEFENVAYYAEKVQKMAAELNEPSWVLNAQYFLGKVHFQNNEGEEALNYYLNLYHKAIHLEDSLHLRVTITHNIAIHCANIYIALNRSQEALPFLYRALEYYLKNNRRTLIPQAYSALAVAYATLHSVDSAEYYVKKTLDSPMKINQEIVDVYRAAAVVDSLKGDYLGAMTNIRKYYHICDSISKEEKSTEMARIKLWHEMEQRDNENLLLQQESRKQYILILTLVALLALLIFCFRRTTGKNRELKNLHLVKDKLFSVIAHDLRSPIGALMSLLKLTNNKMLDIETQDRLFTEISTRVDDTYGLLDNLLYWSKSQMQGITHAPAYFDVRNEICGLMDSLQTVAAAKQITLSNCVESQEVFADRDMFAVVVRNLTTNAIKYTSAEGMVILNSELSGNMLVISVKDTGTGMSQEVQNSLFKLSETKSQYGTRNESGTGLGLVLCADFVKVNGGKIWFNSKQGEGSTFYFSVPVR